MASGAAGGTYAVTCRPPSYSSLSVTNWPKVGDICVDSLLVVAVSRRGVDLEGGQRDITAAITIPRSAGTAITALEAAAPGHMEPGETSPVCPLIVPN
jgi:hypothetical protein